MPDNLKDQVPEENHNVSQLTNIASNSFFKAAVFHEICMNMKEPISLDNFYQIKVDFDLLEKMKSEMLDSQREYASTICILTDLKEKIIDLIMTKKSKLVEEIENSLKVSDLIERRVVNVEHYLETFLISVIGLLSKLCAPVRDAKLEEIKQLVCPFERITEIYQLINLMYIDMTKFALEQVKNFDYSQIVEYEQKKFYEVIDNLSKNNIDGLEKTKLLFEKARQFGKENDVSNQNDLTSVSFVSLLFWEDDRKFPETFVCDFVRIRNLAVLFHLDLFAATISVFSVNLLKNSKWSEFFKSEDGLLHQVYRGVYDLLDAGLENKEKLPIGIFLNKLREKGDLVTEKLVDVILIEAGSSDSRENLKDEYSQHIWKILMRNHPVYTLMRKRAVDYLVKVFSSESPSSVGIPHGFQCSRPNMSIPQKILTGRGKEDAGIEKFQDLQTISGQLLPIFKYNRDIFKKIYDEISTESMN